MRGELWAWEEHPWQRNGECRGLLKAEVGSQAAGIVQGEETRARVQGFCSGFRVHEAQSDGKCMEE